MKDLRKPRIFLLCIILFASAAFALKSWYSIIVADKYPIKLVARGLKLNKEQVYLFSTKLLSSPSTDTVIIPVENKHLPDSLCVLFYDNGWKLKLSSKVRDNANNFDHTKNLIARLKGYVTGKETPSETNPLYPWCCRQSSYETFFSKGSIIAENYLVDEGVKFNYYSGYPIDRLSIQLDTIGDDFYLKTNLGYLRGEFPLSKGKNNPVEISFCNNYDTSAGKFIFSIPILNRAAESESYFVSVDNSTVRYRKSNATRWIPVQGERLLVNDVLFELRNRYGEYVALAFALVWLFVLLISMYSLYRLYKLHNDFEHRNLVVTEQSHLLTLRVLFNCIVFLSFPIVVFQFGAAFPRVIVYSLLVVALNINWVGILHFLLPPSRKVWASISDKLYALLTSLAFFSRFERFALPAFRRLAVFLIPVIVLVVVFLSLSQTKDERLWGIPILHWAKVMYVMLPFLVTAHLIEKPFLIKLAVDVLYLLVFVLSILIAVVSNDLATPFFTLLALVFVIGPLHNGNLKFIIDFVNQHRLFFVIAVVLTSVVVYVYWNEAKVYRFFSIFALPDAEIFQNADEQTKETVASYVYLLESTFFAPSGLDFTQVVLPSWKSVFFSDYAVLWSFKIGGYSFLILYFASLFFITYSILSLLIILNKRIPLKNGQTVTYGNKVASIFNILLALFLVQYVYTFLANLGLFPVTGQSPGILSPSKGEFLFHIVLINGLYFLFLRKKQVVAYSDSQPEVYTHIKKKGGRIFFTLFAISILCLVVQLCRKCLPLEEEMRWEVTADESAVKDDVLDSLANTAFRNGDRDAYRKYHGKFYNNKDGSYNFITTRKLVRYYTSIDSIVAIDTLDEPTAKGEFTVYRKAVNSPFNTTKVLNDPKYSGYPLSSTTINPKLQRTLNLSLEIWAESINKSSHTMISGCIIVAKNDGKLLATASYPFLYNENKSHLNIIESKIRERFRFKFKYQNINSYVNFMEYDQMPGSVIKPLLAYGALEILSLDRTITPHKLNNFLGKSEGAYALTLFKKLSVDIEEFKGLLKEDFGMTYFYDLNQEAVGALNDASLQSYAIGQQNKIPFIDVVQSYTRIMEGQRILYTYDQLDTIVTIPISLKANGLNTLKEAMHYALLQNGTADSVGLALKNVKDFRSFIAKTGTAQTGKDSNHNSTSSFILVTQDYTFGIQLFGDLPNNDSGQAAQKLFIRIIDDLITFDVLEQEKK